MVAPFQALSELLLYQVVDTGGIEPPLAPCKAASAYVTGDNRCVPVWTLNGGQARRVALTVTSNRLGGSTFRRS